MRIWSKILIPVLPTKQLKAMRYELGDMIKQYPNIKHPLVKFANNYDICYLGDYFLQVIKCCEKRNINMKKQYNAEIATIVLKQMDYTEFHNKNKLQFYEDNKEYLKICWWNLYEKRLRGIITQEEWKKIEDLVGDEI